MTSKMAGTTIKQGKYNTGGASKEESEGGVP